jgi:hypothetical protein
MNNCNQIIKSGVNKNNLCQRNIPCKYHKIKIKNAKEIKTVMSLFFMSEKEYNNYQHPNNYHPDKHTLDWMF